jgi:hypothetical protein
MSGLFGSSVSEIRYWRSTLPTLVTSQLAATSIDAALSLI